MLDCKLCGEWSLTKYICDDCYVIKNAMRCFGKDRIIDLINNEFNLKVENKKERKDSLELYNNKDEEDDSKNYHIKEINEKVLGELREKLGNL